MVKRLNVGCGADVRSGWINLDSHNKNGAQVVFNLLDIYKGKLLPFNDEEFDEVLCSHVLEDFISPKQIMDELVRVSNSKIILEVPCDTALNEGNIMHVYPFTIAKLISYAEANSNYGEIPKVRVEEYCYYPTKNFAYSTICCFVKNLLGYRISEATFIKYLFPSGNIRIIYMRR